MNEISVVNGKNAFKVATSYVGEKKKRKKKPSLNEWACLGILLMFWKRKVRVADFNNRELLNTL